LRYVRCYRTIPLFVLPIRLRLPVPDYRYRLPAALRYRWLILRCVTLPGYLRSRCCCRLIVITVPVLLYAFALLVTRRVAVIRYLPRALLYVAFPVPMTPYYRTFAFLTAYLLFFHLRSVAFTVTCVRSSHTVYTLPFYVPFCRSVHDCRWLFAVTLPTCDMARITHTPTRLPLHDLHAVTCLHTPAAAYLPFLSPVPLPDCAIPTTCTFSRSSATGWLPACTLPCRLLCRSVDLLLPALRSALPYALTTFATYVCPLFLIVAFTD